MNSSALRDELLLHARMADARKIKGSLVRLEQMVRVASDAELLACISLVPPPLHPLLAARAFSIEQLLPSYGSHPRRIGGLLRQHTAIDAHGFTALLHLLVDCVDFELVADVLLSLEHFLDHRLLQQTHSEIFALLDTKSVADLAKSEIVRTVVGVLQRDRDSACAIITLPNLKTVMNMLRSALTISAVLPLFSLFVMSDYETIRTVLVKNRDKLIALVDSVDYFEGKEEVQRRLRSLSRHRPPLV